MAYELLHIYKDGGFEYPLPETSFLLDLKYARIDYLKDGLDKELHRLVTEVEELALASSYPSKVDHEFIKTIILDAYEEMGI